MSPFLTLREFLFRLARDRRGAFAILSGILMSLLIAVVVCGLEFTQYMQARAALQNADDALALAAVVEYGDLALTSDGTTIATSYENAYNAAGNEVWPATLSNVTWSAPAFGGGPNNTPCTAAANGVPAIYCPFTATISGTATYTSKIISSIIPISKTLNISVTATASDPDQSVSETGGCNAGAGDTDSVYLYVMPRGMQGNYVPPTTGTYGYDLTSGLLQTNTGYSTCAASGFKGASVTSNVGFAFEDVTGGNGAATTGCDYNYISNGDNGGAMAGNNGSTGGYTKNMNNDQYGNACQSQNWSFSTVWPPSSQMANATGHASCTSSTNCMGSDNTSYAKLYKWGATPTPTSGFDGPSTDNSLQIYQLPTATTPGAASSTMIEPYSGATTFEYNYTSEFTDTSSMVGTCVLKNTANSTNYCTPVTNSMSQACTIAGSAVVNAVTPGSCTTTFGGMGSLSCANYASKNFEYFWNDMGGYPEDMDFADLNYYWSCGASATTAEAVKGFFAYLSQ